jgi:hypothetical protein
MSENELKSFADKNKNANLEHKKKIASETNKLLKIIILMEIIGLIDLAVRYNNLIKYR